MGLFGKKQKHHDAQPVRQEIEVTVVTGTESLEVVGESHRQDELWAIVGGRTTEHVRHPVVAILTPETSNPYDPNAISVWVDGLQVGFLSRENAARYRPGLVSLWQQHGHPIALRGEVVGGGRRDDGSIGYLGVFLEHDPTDFGLESRRRAAAQHLRTGRHEAASLEPLFDNLPSDDVGAIKALRALLTREQDPLARHFAYAELEHRLYHCRDIFTSALDEFDATCEAHHSEMSAIRPRLLTEFAGIPLLETYRQICIRKQKARDWDAVISWAGRGIAIYGEDALDRENLNDLIQREGHASAKLTPFTRAPRPARAPTPEGSTEELTCRRCALVFTRVIARGRKPTLCPQCKELES